MTNPKQIIERLASKEFKIGCHILYKNEVWVFSNDTYKCTDLHQGTYSIFRIRKLNDPHISQEIDEGYKFKILGHPVYIGDVLEETLKKTQDYDARLIELWRKCGLSKSLQQIEEESGYENGCNIEHYPGQCDFSHVQKWANCKSVERLKDPKARELFNFLNQIV